MKIWMTLNAACLVLFITIQASAKSGVEGIWINSARGLTVFVEAIPDGIRVKRTDQQRWYEYEEYRVGQYRDADGNNYYFVDDSKLEWEGKDGKKRIIFSRGSMPEPSIVQNSPKSAHDVHIERNYFYGESARPSELEGRWMNLSTGQSIFIKARANHIKVRAHRGGWTTFFRDDRNTFFDNRGNRYDALPGKMIYRSKTGDFKMAFVPS